MIWNKWNVEEKTKIQRQLLQFTCEKTAAFLAEHPSETFYAFAYDCNTEYGQVSLCLNSEEFFQEGLRWFDIRRFHLAVKRSSKSSYYFPLEKEDLRKVLQIPTEAIQRGLTANPRERQEPLR